VHIYDRAIGRIVGYNTNMLRRHILCMYTDRHAAVTLILDSCTQNTDVPVSRGLGRTESVKELSPLAKSLAFIGSLFGSLGWNSRHFFFSGVTLRARPGRI